MLESSVPKKENICVSQYACLEEKIQKCLRGGSGRFIGFNRKAEAAVFVHLSF